MPDIETTVIDCGNALCVADVGDLYGQLLNELAEGRAVQLNLTKIERIDTAALQIIYAFSKEAEKRGQILDGSYVSEAFMRSATLLGLAPRMTQGQ